MVNWVSLRGIELINLLDIWKVNRKNLRWVMSQGFKVIWRHLFLTLKEGADKG